MKSSTKFFGKQIGHAELIVGMCLQRGGKVKGGGGKNTVTVVKRLKRIP
jgi:hypothetical protein